MQVSLTQVNTAILEATHRLQASEGLALSSAEAKFEAHLLLQHVLQVNRAWIIAHDNDYLGYAHLVTFESLIARRCQGEPVAYLMGEREFYGLTLKVTPDTLIPRPDTETLVEAALAKIPENDNTFTTSFPRRRESTLGFKVNMDSRLRGNDEHGNIEDDHQQLRILDLGTGTGAIALAIASHRPQVEVTAVDASEAALKVAIENAQTLHIQNTRFILSDWFSALSGERFHVIVSNPPYIEQADIHLKQGDLRFEPLSALASGHDGLQDIRHIIQQAPGYLMPEGWLLFEHGYNQAKPVAELLRLAGFVEIGHSDDLAGIARVTMGRMNLA